MLRMTRSWFIRFICITIVVLWLLNRYIPQKHKILQYSLQNHISRLKPERRHVGFLKVHKTGSTTIQNVLVRYALKNNVTAALPAKGVHISASPDPKTWQFMSVPNNHEFEMLFNHVIFSAQGFRNILPNDTIYIASIREPFKQFISAFYYFRTVYPHKYIQNIGGPDPLHQFLLNPSVYESAIQLSWTHNSMARDFGYPSAYIEDIALFKQYLKKLGDFFHLVVVLERLDECMVLMKRLLNWSLKDVIYMKSNEQNWNMTIQQSDRDLHKNWAQLDYILYDFFVEKLEKQISVQSEDFPSEVRIFTDMIKEVEIFCRKDNTTAIIIFDKTTFSSEFTISRKDCLHLMAKEKEILNILVSRRKQALYELGENTHYVRDLRDSVKWSPSIQLEV